MTSLQGLSLTSLPTPDSADSVVLVAGNGGLIGSYVARQYHQLGFEVHGVSRRPLETEWTHHRADLLTGEGLPTDVLSRVTHIVFAAYVEKPTDAELIEVNDALLQGTLDAVHGAGGPLRHVTLCQGRKAYVHHLGFFNTPAKETDPRLIAPHFYYTTEDLLKKVAGERGFAWTALRP